MCWPVEAAPSIYVSILIYYTLNKSDVVMNVVINKWIYYTKTVSLNHKGSMNVNLPTIQLLGIILVSYVMMSENETKKMLYSSGFWYFGSQSIHLKTKVYAKNKWGR